MQQIEIWLVILFLSRKKFHAKQLFEIGVLHTLMLNVTIELLLYNISLVSFLSMYRADGSIVIITAILKVIVVTRITPC